MSFPRLCPKPSKSQSFRVITGYWYYNKTKVFLKFSSAVEIENKQKEKLGKPRKTKFFFYSDL